MFKIPLRLKSKLPSPDRLQSDRPASDQPAADQPEGLQGIQMMGAAAIAMGILGIFTKGYIFVPLAFVCSVVALFQGYLSWAFVGLLLAVAGLLTSPILLALIGIGWLLP
jgi:hypothetical protein